MSHRVLIRPRAHRFHLLAGALLVVAQAAAQLYQEAPGSPFAVGSFPESVAVTPDGAFLYVNNSSDDTISAFAVDPDGFLTAVPGSPFATDANALALATDGDHLFVANGLGSNSLAVYTIGSGGGLAQVTGSPFASGGSATQHLALSRTGQYLIATNAGSDDFGVFAVNALTGALSPVAESPFRTGDEPQGIAVCSSSDRIAIASCVGDRIELFGLPPSTGVPVPVIAQPYAGVECPFNLVFDLSGDHLYVDALNSFNGFSISMYGALDELPGSPYTQPGPTSRQGIALAADGARVLTTGRDSGSGESFLVVYALRAGGELVPYPGSPYLLARRSWTVVADPEIQQAYLSDSVAGSVTVLRGPLFADDFEVEDTGFWSATVP